MAWVRCCGGNNVSKNIITKGSTAYYPISTANGSITYGTDYIRVNLGSGTHHFYIMNVDVTNYTNLKIKMNTNASNSQWQLQNNSQYSPTISTSDPTTLNISLAGLTGVVNLDFVSTRGGYYYDVYEIELAP